MNSYSCIFSLHALSAPEQAVTRARFGLQEEHSLGAFSVVQDENIVICNASIPTTPEEVLTEPLWKSSDIIAAFNGRIDNRDELIALLAEDLADCTESVISDIRLVISLYRKLDAECFSRIVGDFAIALYDVASHTVYLARDPFAVGQLFYSIDEDSLFFATDAAFILRTWDKGAAISERYIALYLAYSPDGLTTPFEGINAVPAGMLVRFNAQGVKLIPSWNLSLSRQLSESSEQKNYELFRHLLTEAVEVRLRADKPVFAHLSGGLDSSSIVCLADDIRSRDQRIKEVHTISHVFHEASQSDEREYITLVEDMRGKKGYHILEDDDRILSRWADDSFISYPNISHALGGFIRGTISAMRATDSKALLSGVFGDQVLMADHKFPYDAADKLYAGKIFNSLNLCYRWATAQSRPLSSVFWHAAVVPNLPARLIHPAVITSARANASLADFTVTLPAWMSPRLTNSLVRGEVLQEILEGDLRYGAGSRRIRFGRLLAGVRHFAVGFRDYHGSFGQLDVRYPYLHRPLIEFLTSVPYEELSRPRSARRIQRRALEGVLPDGVRFRRSKGSPAEAILKAVRREWRFVQDLANNSLAVDFGYVDYIALHNEMERWRSGRQSSDPMMFIALEMWLRALRTKRLV